MVDRLDFPMLGANELDALRTVGVARRFPAGQRLVSLGADSSEVFYLLSGLVKIVVIASNGVESMFGLRTAGDFIGEMSTLSDERRSADVIAVDETVAVMVTAARFTDFVLAHPAVALALLRMQTRRLNEMTMRSVLGSRSVKARAALRLLELAQDSPDVDSVHITQGDLAKYIDASREWTSKALGELRRAGAIRTARGRVHLLDHEVLHIASLDD